MMRPGGRRPTSLAGVLVEAAVAGVVSFALVRELERLGLPYAALAVAALVLVLGVLATVLDVWRGDD